MSIVFFHLEHCWDIILTYYIATTRQLSVLDSQEEQPLIGKGSEGICDTQLKCFLSEIGYFTTWSEIWHRLLLFLASKRENI